MMDDRTHLYLYRQDDQPWAVRATDVDTAASQLRDTLGEPDLDASAIVSIDGASDAPNVTWPDRLPMKPPGTVFRVRDQPDPTI